MIDSSLVPTACVCVCCVCREGIRDGNLDEVERRFVHPRLADLSDSTGLTVGS